ncbi:MAG: phosphatidylglycerophosphatase A [Synergistaceae bacterium]|nr:phosphatidylglycerophosphatase A [Synergistaceae bacterium]
MLDKLAVLIATICGAGFLTKAPGTVGSVIAALISAFINVNIYAILLIIILGVWASCRAEQILGSSYAKEHDPGCIVIDEAVGVWLAVLFLPKTFIIPALVLFRIVDILKPWPVYLFERLPSGWGIMADDIAGGIIVNLLLQLFIIYY